jgi:hypothetical protein
MIGLDQAAVNERARLVPDAPDLGVRDVLQSLQRQQGTSQPGQPQPGLSQPGQPQPGQTQPGQP